MTILLQDPLSQEITTRSHAVLRSDQDVYNASVSQAKQYFDSLSNAAITNNKQKKKTKHHAIPLQVVNFDVDQIWEQARLLLERVSKSVEISTGDVVSTNGIPQKGVKRKRHGDNDMLDDSDSEMIGSEDEDEGSDISSSGSDDEGSSGAEDNGDVEEAEEEHPDAGEDLEDNMTEEEDDGVDGFEEEDVEFSDEDEGGVRFVKGIDDEFFSIDKFNKDTEQFERADELGKPVDERDLDIDWNADIPDELDDDNEEEMEDDDDDNDAEDDANGIMYQDFFRPPKKAVGPPKKGASGKDRTDSKKKFDESEDVTSLMERLERDLFEEDDNEEESEQEEEQTAPNGAIGTNASTHARRQAALTDQIRKLELENISKREWTLSGEARAQQRPLNSLLEEDLDFERTGKAVPVITQEITTSLEDMIKGRILAANFDDIPRRRPDDVGPSYRKTRQELDDSKSKLGLAEIYEKEHLRAIDPVNNPTPGGAKADALRKEISALFSTVSNQLDSLSSWQFMPKTPKPSLAVVNDTRTISMEEANVNIGALSVSDTTRLAPQEIYNPTSSETKQAGEVIGKSGIPVTSREMTKQQKTKERRQKKKQKKMTFSNPSKPATGKENSKEKNVLKDLKAGNVSVIGKHGERTDVSGQSLKQSAPLSGTAFKL